MRHVFITYFPATLVIAIGLLTGPAYTHAQEPVVEAVAYRGTPYGIGRFAVTFPGATQPALVKGQELWLTEKEGRSLYPVYQIETVSSPALESKPKMRQIT